MHTRGFIMSESHSHGHDDINNKNTMMKEEKFPTDLSQANALRDKKRNELTVLFERYRALQREMKFMEEELMELDEHIDTILATTATATATTAAATTATGTTTNTDADANLDVDLDTDRHGRLSYPSTCPSEILTDPATQTQQCTQSEQGQLQRQQHQHQRQYETSAEPVSSVSVQQPPQQRSMTTTAATTTTTNAKLNIVKPAPLQLSSVSKSSQHNSNNNKDVKRHQSSSSSSSCSASSVVDSALKKQREDKPPKSFQAVGNSSLAPFLPKRGNSATAQSSVPSSSGRISTTNAPRPEYPHKDRVYHLLRHTFGLQSFRHAQEDIIHATLDGQDVFVVMRTGGGKSLTYQLPALLEQEQQSSSSRGCGAKKITLVVTPLISLMHDQEMQLNRLRPGAAVSFSSGMGTTEHARRWNLVRDPSAGVAMILVTPEKIHKSSKLRSELQALHAVGRLGRFVIDEAHCASQWGISFRPDYAQLGILKRHFPSIPVLAVTATASERVRQDVCNILGLHPRTTRVFRSTANRPNLRYSVRPKPDGTKNAVTVDMAAYIQTQHARHSGIIYTLSRKEADTVAASLDKEYGIVARAYHSDVNPTTKERIQNQWMQGKVQVVVATIAFGLGINKPDVRFVLHHCISKNLDSYYQESGRAGRDGEPADCVLYYSPKDVPRMRAMVEDTPGGAENLWTMVRYAQAFGNDAVCRAILLDSLGEPDAPSPVLVQEQHGNTTTERRDVGKHAQVVTQLVAHYQQLRESVTLAMLVKAWRSTKDVPECVAANPPKDLTLSECEQIVVALLLQDVLEFRVHWTAYQAVAYIRLGRSGEPFCMSLDPKCVLRFPLASKKGAAATKTTCDSSEWLSAVKRKPATKKATKKKATAKKATAGKKRKAPVKKATKVRTKRTAVKKETTANAGKSSLKPSPTTSATSVLEAVIDLVSDGGDDVQEEDSYAPVIDYSDDDASRQVARATLKRSLSQDLWEDTNDAKSCSYDEEEYEFEG